ncbi:MAG TPA: hypothetical protein VGN09_23195 [Vicinamibacteria bacterium]|jgi:hypothetical protein
MHDEDHTGTTPATEQRETERATKPAPKRRRRRKGSRKRRDAANRLSVGAGLSKGKGKKGGPRPFPKVPLSKALLIAQKIKELNGGEPWPPAQVAEALGMGARGDDFYYVTASARDFGLTTGTRSSPTIELTDLGRAIVYAPNPEVEAAKKLEAFHKVELFSKVLNHYKGSNLPEMKYLANTLEHEFGLDPSFHEEFSRVFRENCQYLGITSGDVIAFPDSETAAQRPPTTVVVGEPTKRSTVRAFVVMPFVEKGASSRPQGFFAEVLRSLITPAGIAAGFNVETANRQGSDVIQSTIVNELLDADLVIADLTDHNPNVLFELGLRIAEEKPVALIKAAGTGRVFDVDNMMRVVEYQPNLWRSTIETDIPELTKHFKAAWDNRSKDQSYMKILRRAGAATQERSA